MSAVLLDEGLVQGDTVAGILERWFGNTTEAANEGRVGHEGLRFFLFEGKKFLLRDAVAERGADIVGPSIFDQDKRWPVYSKFFDNMGPIPHHRHHGFEDAAVVGQEGKSESYYFPPQLNNVDNNFAIVHSSMPHHAAIQSTAHRAPALATTASGTTASGVSPRAWTLATSAEIEADESEPAANN